MLITDQQARTTALDPSRSFIVQAPAGSGKTELLTQRYLQLLQHVDNAPEEIVAITFTQKAAAEMRERILNALELAAHTPNEPNEPHKKLTWSLAKAALQRSEREQWDLHNNPKRIRVLTIDALCLSITQSAPLISELGVNPSIGENTASLYQQAIDTLFSMDHLPAITRAIETLLLHLDNRVEYLSELLGFMLQKRDQWLPAIMASSDANESLKTVLETTLQHIAQQTLQELHHQLSPSVTLELSAIAEQVRDALKDLDNPDLAALNSLTATTGFTHHDLPVWQAVSCWLLTSTNQWRKSINKNQGFAPKVTAKAQMKTLLAELSASPALLSALVNVRLCPPLTYNTQQWEVLESLLTLLPSLVACLKVVMQQQGQIDFLEITLAALRALGDEEHPTDLALYLDYQIHHLLIDEFQDTSTLQYRFFEKLISQWTPEENRSLFLVGDPMQSIYRFRNAEVSLFLQAKKIGMANIPLTFLQLECNFRSTSTVVNWFNDTFENIMPSEDNTAIGAIQYSRAMPTNDKLGAVAYHASTSRDDIAHQVINIIQSIDKKHSIAILVRSRSQLGPIILELQNNHVPYSAIDIEPLAQRPEIQDLYQLTQAILHYDDTVAWLSVLRAPFCGLNLADLHTLSHFNPAQTVPYNLTQPALLPLLSEDGQLRLQHCLQGLAPVLHHLGRHPLSTQIQQAWSLLNADRVYTTASQQNNIQRYFDLLLQLENTGTLRIEKRILTQELNKLFANTTQSDANVHIMTIHKSKGLEFDHVILPYLEKKAANNTSQLLQWLEHTHLNDNQSPSLLLAPIKHCSESHDPIYHYLQRIEKQKLSMESTRLFYVACTRAKIGLHFLATVDTKEGPELAFLSPSKSSQLHWLWPQYQERFIQKALQSHSAPTPTPNNTDPTLQLERLRSSFLNTVPAANSPPSTPATAYNNSPHELALAAPLDLAPFIGTLIHRELQMIATTDIKKWNPGRVKAQQPRWVRQCHQALIQDNNDIDRVVQMTTEALLRTLADPKGQWILSQQHQRAYSEWAINYTHQGTVATSIVDRFIIDDNTAWIIDFKTGAPTTQTSAEFIDQQSRQHKTQLQHYQSIIASLVSIPIKTALYFPRCNPTWVEINLK